MRQKLTILQENDGLRSGGQVVLPKGMHEGEETKLDDSNTLGT